jgi:hypothetical protein
MARHKFTIGTLFLVVLSFAVALAFFRFDTLLDTRLMGFCCFGASVGWPLGYVLGGRGGAFYGALIGGIPTTILAILIWF